MYKFFRMNSKNSCILSYLNSQKHKIKLQVKMSISNSNKNLMFARTKIKAIRPSKLLKESTTKEQEKCYQKISLSIAKSINL